MRKDFFQSTWFYIPLLVVLSIPLCVHLLGDRLVQGHDAMGGFLRQICIEQNWGHGQFIIRWSPDVNFGYGSPIFNFYPPFFYYVSLLFSTLAHNTIFAMNLTCVLFWILSGVGMYLLVREFWGNKGGLLSAILYVYAPYHVQDFYVRGAFSEFSAFMVFPFLMFSIYKINRQVSTRYVFLGVISASISILTHGMGTFFLIVALAYVLFLFFSDKDRWTLFLRLCVLLTGFMMSAFYWLPALWEAKYTNLNFIISMRYDFHKNFISLAQLFSLPWGQSGVRDDLSFQIGIIPLILLFLSFFSLLSILRKNSSLVGQYCFFLMVGFIAILLTLPISQIVWEHVNSLRFLEFPWRFLTIAAFAVSFLGGSSMMLFRKMNVSLFFLGVFVLLIMVLPIKYYWPGHFQVLDQAGVKNTLSNYPMLGEGEPTPKWIKVPPPPSFSPQKFQIIEGSGQLFQYRTHNPVDHFSEVMANQPLAVCFHAFYFPGWQAFIDGQETTINADNPFGFIVFLVPPGEHTLRVAFGLTPVREIAMLISWAAFVLSLGGIWWVKFSKQGI